MSEIKVIRFKDPWGFSKLDVFRLCKRKFKYQFIDKLPSGSSPAMDRGQRMHEEIEAYINGWSKDLSEEVVDWKEAFDKLRQIKAVGERSLGISRQWEVLPDWFDKRTWLRVKMDAHYRAGRGATAIDFKSGKFREPSADQIEIYACALLALFPDIEEVLTEFWFLDVGDVHTYNYNMEKLKELRKKFETESLAMYTEERWDPEPSKECRYCPYSQTKGGPCQY